MVIDKRYKVISSLDGGNVYKVRDTLTNSIRVLKMCSSEEPDVVMEFKNEFFTLSNLNHPNIVEVYDFKKADNSHYFTMEFVEGDDIFNHFVKKKADYESLYSVIGDLLQVLHHVHQEGLIHGDIKPQNIIVQNGRAKLLDFGLARLVGSSSKSAGGTLAYIAPELFKGGKIDPRVDLYSLGVVLHEILGRERIHSLDQKLPPLKAPVPKPLKNLVSKLTKRDPDQRYSCVEEVWQGLCEYLPEMSFEFKPSALTSRTIGRDSEMSLLQRLYKHAKKEGKIALIVGERGIGKSRILRELGYGLQMEDCHVIHLACPRGEKSPLSLVKRMLQEAGKRLEREMEIPSDFSQESARLKLFEELTGTFVELSDIHKPLVLLVDELDCADVLSIDFLGYLAPEIASRSIFFVGVVEDETKLGPLLEKTTDMELLTTLELTRLNSNETKTMISSMLSSENLNGIAEWVYEKTAGNPLHVEKTLEYLIKIGCISRLGDGWTLDRVKAEKLQPIPSLRSVIDISLKSCEEEELRLLQYASVIGNFFDIRLLQQLSQCDDRHFYPILLKLRYSDAIREIKATEYGFSHGWMREVLYERISDSRKKELHLKTFRIMKKTGWAPAEALFYHALHSDLDSDAYEYALRAGENAEKSLAPETALQYYQTALRLTQKLGRGREGFLYEKLGDLLHLTGSYEEALKKYDLALETSSASDGLYLKMGKIYRDRGDYLRAVDYFGHVLASKSPRYPEALNQIAWAYLETGQLKKALESTMWAKEVAEKRGHRKSLADSYHNLAQASLREGNHEEAIRHFHSSLKIKDEIGDNHGKALTQNNLAILHWNRGEIAEAERHFRHGLELMEKIGDVKTMALLNNNLGMVYRQKTEWKKALEHYERSQQIYRKIGDKKSLAAVYNNVAVVHRHQGRWKNAVEFYQKSLSLSEEMGVQNEQAIILQNIGSILLDMGKLEEAHSLLQDSFDLRRRLGDKEGAAAVLTEIGRYWMERKIWERAAKTLNRGLNQLMNCGNEQEVARIYLLQTLICLRTGKLRPARSRLAKAEECCRKLDDREGLGRIERLKGLFHSLKQQSEQAVGCYKKSLEIFKELDEEYEFGVTLLELAHHYLRNWSGERKVSDIQNGVTTLREAEEIFDRLEVTGKLEDAHKASGEMLDLISGSFLPAYSRVNQLNTLYDISRLVNSILDLDLLFSTTMELVIQLLNAERGVLLLLDPETRRLEVAAGKGMDKETIRDVTKLSRSIIARVAKKGEPIICMDALSDTRFKDRKSVILQKIRSLLCVPLKTNERVLGTIYVDSRLSDNVFREQDKDFLLALANLVAVAIDRARLHQKMEKETVNLKREVVKRYSFQGLVGKSEKMQEIYSLIEKVARTDSTVLLTGESGTGKDLAAMAIHLLSGRKDHPFVTVSCPSIPRDLLGSELFGHVKGAFTGATKNKKGLFEAANEGTIFLNEIADAPPAVQAGLLRVLEAGEIRRIGETRSRKVNVRVICATNKDLKRKIEENQFREDLYYRLNVVHIPLPPLRERREDIPLIADHFRRLQMKDLKRDIAPFNKEIIDFLCKHEWSGNVRELQNCIARTCAMADSNEIAVCDVSIEEEIPEKVGGLKEAKELFEIRRVLNALKQCGGNRTKAAELLGIRRQQLQRYIRKYEISMPSQKEEIFSK